MFRLFIILIAGAILAACGSTAEMRAKQKAMLDANKIPDVQLTPEQTKALTAKLQNIYKEEAQISWVQAGRQEDGKIFVCYVTKTPDLFRIKDHVGVYTGTFEADGSFKPTPPPFAAGKMFPVQMCHSKGFSPPVRLRIQ